MRKMETILRAFPQWGKTLESGPGTGCVSRELDAEGTKNEGERGEQPHGRFENQLLQIACLGELNG